MYCVTKATTIQFIDGKCHIEQLKNRKDISQSQTLYITPYHTTSYYNGLGEGHTQISHRHSQIKQFQETKCALAYARLINSVCIWY